MYICWVHFTQVAWSIDWNFPTCLSFCILSCGCSFWPAYGSFTLSTKHKWHQRKPFKEWSFATEIEFRTFKFSVQRGLHGECPCLAFSLPFLLPHFSLACFLFDAALLVSQGHIWFLILIQGGNTCCTEKLRTPENFLREFYFRWLIQYPVGLLGKVGDGERERHFKPVQFPF